MATVVPWLTVETSSAWAPACSRMSRSPSAKACDGSDGTDGVLVACSWPVASSKATTSVNVPPVSMPIRMVGPAFVRWSRSFSALCCQRRNGVLETLHRRVDQARPDLAGSGRPTGHAGIDRRDKTGAHHAGHVDAGRRTSEVHRGDLQVGFSVKVISYIVVVFSSARPPSRRRTERWPERRPWRSRRCRRSP